MAKQRDGVYDPDAPTLDQDQEQVVLTGARAPQAVRADAQHGNRSLTERTSGSGASVACNLVLVGGAWLAALALMQLKVLPGH